MGSLTGGCARLLADVADVDERGLKYAEDLLHEVRVRSERTGYVDTRLLRALEAISGVRALANTGLDRRADSRL